MPLSFNDVKFGGGHGPVQILKRSLCYGGKIKMPLYEYQCVDCSATDQRVAGIDDYTALCVACGGLMLRLDEDVFQPEAEKEGEGGSS